MVKMKTAAERRRTLPVWIATVAGAGYFPVAPGTVGSAVAVAWWPRLDAIPLAPRRGVCLLALLVAPYFFLRSVGGRGEAKKFFGRTDPGHVVIDEVAGQMVAFLLVPHASWKLLLAGFALFRFFDVTKPFPAGRAERLPGGWGIMVDDVVAGAYALGALAFLGYIIR